MITWMQRHKKWLVITIWISTIAFIGAGFVGWGSYNFGSKGGAVAVVGDRQISVDEYQREYSSLYDQYSRVYGQQFNKQIAEKMKLKEIAYNTVIQKNLILSFADEIGLDVTNEEIAKELVKIPGFIKNGKFDKETYIKVLHQNRTKPAIFEATLKRDLLLEKIEKIFNISVQQNEIESLSRLFFSQDDINIEILNQKDISLKYSDDDLKKYWDSNKDNYKSETLLNLKIEEIPLVSKEYTEEEIKDQYAKFKTTFVKEDGKIKSLDEAKDDIIKSLNEKETKRSALKKFLKLKKGEEKFSTSKSIEQSKLSFSDEENSEIISASAGDVIKPFFDKDKYIIVKVVNKVLPKTLSFEKAKEQVRVDYEKITRGLELEKLATKRLKIFEGIHVGYVSRDSFNKIPGLNQNETMTFLNRLFSSEEKSGKITIADKIVLYKINAQKLASYDKSKDEIVKSSVNNLLNQELMNNLVKNLQNRYEVQSSITFKE